VAKRKLTAVALWCWFELKIMRRATGAVAPPNFGLLKNFIFVENISDQKSKISG